MKGYENLKKVELTDLIDLISISASGDSGWAIGEIVYALSSDKGSGAKVDITYYFEGHYSILSLNGFDSLSEAMPKGLDSAVNILKGKLPRGYYLKNKGNKVKIIRGSHHR
jgi:hypothetical protein